MKKHEETASPNSNIPNSAFNLRICEYASHSSRYRY